MTRPVPRPPYARARVVGPGRTAELLVRALEARVTQETEWIREGDARIGDADLLLLVSPDAAQVTPWTDRHPDALCILLTESLAGLAASGERYVAGAHPLIAPRLPAEELPEDAFVGCHVAIAEIPGAHPSSLALAERFWLLLGAIPVPVSAEDLEGRAALTEWLPLVAAAGLARLAGAGVAAGSARELLVAPAFLDATAILCAEPEGGAPPRRLAAMARSLAKEIEEAAGHIEKQDDKALEAWWARARSFRRRFPDS